jgi:hypothetical protein
VLKPIKHITNCIEYANIDFISYVLAVVMNLIIIGIAACAQNAAFRSKFLSGPYTIGQIKTGKAV